MIYVMKLRHFIYFYIIFTKYYSHIIYCNIYESSFSVPGGCRTR
jgi:hypothetical protein